MRLFKGSSGRKNALKQSKQPSYPSEPDHVSIGSELAVSDQFEILLVRKVVGGVPQDLQSLKKKKKGSIMEYFNSGNDDSTISSITTVEHRGFPRFASRSYNHPGAATSLMVALCSGCCCGSDTPVAYPMSTDNTLIARNSTFGTLSASNSFQSVNHSRSLVVRNGKCFGQEYLSAQSIRRPKLLGRRGWSRWQKPPTEKMSPSLFDNLSEDELDEEMNRTGCDVGAKKQKRGLPLRGVLTWKRK